MDLITVMAPAKINLYLEILKKREDNYHEVEMIMQSVDLCDSITVSKTNNAGINLTSNYKFSGARKKNTAYKAAEKFFEKSQIKNPGININIEKNIPICAGLAGGSADAAAVLVALNRMFSTNYSKSDLALIGKEIGADVPFCVFGGTMLASGTGTTLTPLKYMPQCHVVLCKPNLYISTKEAYSKFDGNNFSSHSIKKMLNALDKRNLSEVSENLYNRFESILNLKVISKIKQKMKRCGAWAACMSGSGPTVYGIFNSEAQAKICTEELKKYYKNVFLCKMRNSGCYFENNA